MRRPTPRGAATVTHPLLLSLICALTAAAGHVPQPPPSLSLPVLRRLAACARVRVTLAELDMESGVRRVSNELRVSPDDDDSGGCLELLGGVCDRYGLSVCMGVDMLESVGRVSCVDVDCKGIHHLVAAASSDPAQQSPMSPPF